MKRILLIIIIASVISSVFGVGSIVYNGTDSLSSISTPSLSVTLSSEGYTLGLGFSSTDPKSTSGITNISEMPLTLYSELDANTGKIMLIGRKTFFVWWQIQLPIEDGKTGYAFYIKKDANLINGTYSVPYTAKLTLDSSTKKEITTAFQELDKYTTYSASTIYVNSFPLVIESNDASIVPYGTVLSSSITLEVKTI